MKNIEEQALDKAKEVLKDFGIDYYFEDTFQVFKSDSSENVLEVFVKVPNEQFDWLKGSLLIELNEQGLEPFKFSDMSGGRIPPVKISKKEGKYYLGE